MVENRLNQMVGEGREFNGFDSLVRAIRIGDRPDLENRVISRMSTHYSYFFREPIHFSFLQHRLLGDWRSRQSVKILSAACAGGQEAWSAAMCTEGARQAIHTQSGGGGKVHFPQVRIDGLDVAPDSVVEAQTGIYEPQEVEPFVVGSARQKYFRQLADGRFSIADFLRGYCTFSVMNMLAADRIPSDSYDIVFLRNVLMYFKPEERRILLLQVRRILKRDGWLVISLSESLGGLDVPFRIFRYSIYRPC